MHRAMPLLLLVAACGGSHSDAAPAKDTTAVAAPGGPPAAAPVLPPQTDTTVSWEHLVQVMRKEPDAVRAVRQTHAREVTVLMKDGRSFHTREPAIDDIVKVTREIDPSGGILIATE